jgi:outer membrane lipopolysaccharide assembly protein LptE/RlpB
MNKAIKFSLLLLVVSLTSCGYRLCNPCVAWPDSVKRVLVTTDTPSSPVYAYLKDNLSQQSLVLVSDETLADAVFVLLSEKRDRRLLAVGNGNEPAEYELIYHVRYRIDARRDQTEVAESEHQTPFSLGDSKEVESRRAQVFNPDAVLAVEREAESLYDEMAQYLANQITRSAVGQLTAP